MSQSEKDKRMQILASEKDNMSNLQSLLESCREDYNKLRKWRELKRKLTRERIKQIAAQK